MRNKWLKHTSNFLPIIFLFSLCLFVFLKNFTSKTFLLGWDNLAWELNMEPNIVRLFGASWQEYQGVGLVGGMAHVADLPRLLLFYPATRFVSIDLVRYVWAFIMLFLGPVGIYCLVKSMISKKSDLIGPFSGFVAAIFYLYNLATVQYFFVPFESFIGFYAFLPWLIYLVQRYLKSGKIGDLLLFFLVFLMATTSFYVQTLFIVFLVVLFVIFVEAIVKLRARGFIRSLILLLTTILVNAFWLLPVIYFSFSSSSLVGVSHINSIATPETAYMNQARGDVKNIISQKGYWLDYYDYFSDGFDYMYRDWIPWASNQSVSYIAMGLSIVSIIGLILAIFKRKIYPAFSFVLILLISYFMLAGLNPPFGRFYQYLSDNVPLFSEIFRNSFTKWSIIFSFCLSIGLGFFVANIKFRRKKIKYVLSIPLALLIIGLSVYAVKPVFEGKLISQKMRVEVPSVYFDLFDFFKSQDPNRRIANLPFINFFGWTFNSWGYNGSGFLWYGIENPILDRAFDVWSDKNESFYNQASYALYKKDIKLFESVLNKYDVKYLLLDESIINPGGDRSMLFIDEIKEIADKSEYINMVWNKDFLTVYEVNTGSDSKFISAPPSFSFVNADTVYSNIDPVYFDFGDYVFDGNSIGYPFVNLDQRKDVEIKAINLLDGTQRLVFENKNTGSTASFPVSEIYKENFVDKRGFGEAYNCDLKKNGEAYKENTGEKVIYKAENGGVSCDYYDYNYLDPTGSYILHIKGRNVKGRSLKIYLQNLVTKRMDIEELLPEGELDSYFAVLPSTIKDIEEETKDETGKEEKLPGYVLNVETRSFGRVGSENEIDLIEFIPFDWDLILDINTKGSDETPQKQPNPLIINDVVKWGTSYYEVDTQKNSDGNQGLLVLGQGYEKGWLGYFMPDNCSKGNSFSYLFCRAFPWWSGGEKLDHRMVNSWSNGWIVPQDKQDGKIIIVFWPQYLEWGGMLAGFLSLLVLTGFIVISNNRKLKN